MANFKLEFPSGSTVSTATPSICAANTLAGFTSPTPTCTSSASGVTPPYVCVNNLNTGQASYDFMINTGFVNAKVAKKVIGIRCVAYDASGTTCGSAGYLEEKNTVKIQYTANELADKVTVTLSDATNGVNNAVATFAMQTANPIVISGSVWLLMPKSNQNYLKSGFGTTISTCLINEADLVLTYTPTVTFQWGSIGSTSRAPLPIITKTFEADYTTSGGESFDLLKVTISNSVEIPMNNIIELVVSDIKNPPSLNPITNFQMKTGDATFNVIDEQITGIYLRTLLPGPAIYDTSANQLSAIAVVGANAAAVAANSKVSTPMVDYQVTMYFTNNIPINSKLYIQYPTAWSVADASFVQPTVTCQLYCDITNSGIIVTKNNADNTLIVTNMFTGFQNAPGPLTFTMVGNTNPATTARMYFTITTYNEDGAVYKIDESSSLFYLDF
jgi:hypothetical protein